MNCYLPACRPLKPEFDKLKEEIGDLARSEEDVLSYALFPQVAKGFFERRIEKRKRRERRNYRCDHRRAPGVCRRRR